MKKKLFFLAAALCLFAAVLLPGFSESKTVFPKEGIIDQDALHDIEESEFWDIDPASMLKIKSILADRAFQDSIDGFPGIKTFNQPLSTPYRLTSGYGTRIHPITGDKEFHRAVDMAGDEGDPIATIAEGKVIKVGNSRRAGKYIKILHRTRDGKYIISGYAHLDTIFVKEGEILPEAGLVIGLMGNTGWSTGDHLHFSLRYVILTDNNICPGNWINPTPYIKEKKNFLADFGQPSTQELVKTLQVKESESNSG